MPNDEPARALHAGDPAYLLRLYIHLLEHEGVAAQHAMDAIDNILIMLQSFPLTLPLGLSGQSLPARTAGFVWHVRLRGAVRNCGTAAARQTRVALLETSSE